MNKEKKRQKDKEDLEMISNVQGKLLNGYHEWKNPINFHCVKGFSNDVKTERLA